jgi:hypothetical protein
MTPLEFADQNARFVARFVSRYVSEREYEQAAMELIEFVRQILDGADQMEAAELSANRL